MTRRTLCLATATVVVAAADVVAGCGGGSNTGAPSTATPAAAPTTTAPTSGDAQRAAACVSVPPALNHAILSHVVLASARFVKLRATRATATQAFYYVSGAVSGSGADDMVATWATADLDGHKPIYSVDANAALISVFGASSGVSLDLSISAPGAFRSRKCVDRRATLGSPAPPGGRGGAPSGQ